MYINNSYQAISPATNPKVQGGGLVMPWEYKCSLYTMHTVHYKIVNTMCHISIFRLEEMVPTQAGHVIKQMNILSLPCRQREGKGERNPASQMSCIPSYPQYGQRGKATF